MDLTVTIQMKNHCPIECLSLLFKTENITVQQALKFHIASSMSQKDGN